MSGQKCTEVQSWKAAHLPTLEIRVEQKGNLVMKSLKSPKCQKKIEEVALAVVAFYISVSVLGFQ